MLRSLSLVSGIVILMILLAIPVVRQTRRDNRARACQDNLAALLAAKERYMLYKDLKPSAKIDLETLVADTTASLAKKPVCPEGGTYQLNPIGVLPACSVEGHALPMAGKQRTGSETLSLKSQAGAR